MCILCRPCTVKTLRCNYGDQPFSFYSVVYTCAAALPIKRILELQLTQTAAQRPQNGTATAHNTLHLLYGEGANRNHSLAEMDDSDYICTANGDDCDGGDYTIKISHSNNPRFDQHSYVSYTIYIAFNVLLPFKFSTTILLRIKIHLKLCICTSW